MVSVLPIAAIYLNKGSKRLELVALNHKGEVSDFN